MCLQLPLSVAVITPKEYPNIWYEEPVVTEMPSDNTALQFC